MLNLFLALALVVAMMFTYLRAVQAVLDPETYLRRTIRRLRVRRQARLACADLEREYASLLDEYRPIP